MNTFRFPTPEEMTALRAAAHRARARHMKLMLVRCLRALNSLFAHCIAPRRVSHA